MEREGETTKNWIFNLSLDAYAWIALSRHLMLSLAFKRLAECERESGKINNENRNVTKRDRNIYNKARMAQ